MWKEIRRWLFADPERKSHRRQLLEISAFYGVFLLVVWFHDQLPVSITSLVVFFPVALVLAYYWEQLRELLRVALVAGIIVFGFIRPYVVQAFYIPSRSMENTLQVNDHIFVNKFIYYLQDPDRYDVIVFEYPNDPSKDYIKRLVGLPGDSVAVRDHHLHVNGRALRRQLVTREVEIQLFDPVESISTTSDEPNHRLLRLQGDGLRVNQEWTVGASSNPVNARVGVASIYREARGHRIKAMDYEGLNGTPAFARSFGPVRIPRPGQTVELDEVNPRALRYYAILMRQWFPGDAIAVRNGHIYQNGSPRTELRIREPLYFVMGDNRDHSEDSRVWGFVPESRLLGEAFFIYWPLSRLGIIGSR